MPLKIYRRGEVWHYRGTVAGRRLRGSTGTANKDAAARIAAEVESRQWKCHLDGPEAVLTFAQAALLYRRDGKSTRFLEKVEDHWKDTLVKDINPGAIRQAAIELYPNGSPATRNRQAIVPTIAIINHAAELELCPPIRIKRFKVDTKVKKPATAEWIRALMAAANEHIGALGLFMFLTGARVSEAIAVKWSDVDLQKKTVTIRQTKTRAERTAHLPQPLVVALANLPREPRRGVFFYVTRGAALNAWRDAIAKAGIEPLSFHCCRHGFATALLHAGVDPVTIAKLGGWKSPAHVFNTYGHAKDDRKITDVIFDTPLTQANSRTQRKQRKTGTI
jgi:integrase